MKDNFFSKLFSKNRNITSPEEENPEVKLNENLSFKNKGRFADEFENSKNLPAFNSQNEANEYFIKQKDNGLDVFINFINEHKYLTPDFSPESLKELELLYFDLYEQSKFGSNLITRVDFEVFMSLYYGEVMVRNTVFEWGAEKHFLTENAYYLSIRKPQMSIAVARRKDYYATKNNKRRQALYREYKRYSE